MQPVPVGVAFLDFHRADTAGDALIVSKYVPQPFHSWSFTDSQLVGLTKNSRVPRLPLGPGAQLSVEYTASDANWDAQDEVLLFARDPSEIYEELRVGDSSTEDFAWRDTTSTAKFPVAVAMTYPPQPGMAAYTPLRLPVSTGHFFPGLFPNTPKGPAAQPNENSSVKAARVVHHGICSQLVPYVGTADKPGILEHISDEVYRQFVDSVTSSGGDATRSWSHATSFLNQVEDKQDAQIGGFFFAARLGTELPFIYNDNDIGFNVAYQTRLYDGRLYAQPLPESSFVSGHKAEESNLALLSVLLDEAVSPQLDPLEPLREDSIPRSVFAEASNTQQYHGADASPDGNGILEPCAQDRLGLDSVPVVPTNPIVPTEVLKCVAWAKKLESDAVAAAVALGTPLTSDEERIVTESMFATYKDPTNGKDYYRNLRCHAVPVAATPNTRCEYILRAKRLNALPQGPELVFLDYENEISNPTFPVYLILKRGGTIGTGSLLRKLCSREPEPIDATTPYYTRRFAAVRRGKAFNYTSQ